MLLQLLACFSIIVLLFAFSAIGILLFDKFIDWIEKGLL